MRHISKELLKGHQYLEVVLVAAIFGVTAVMLSYSVENLVVLHLYYVPVVLTGFFRGAYRARLMSLLSILTATIVFLPSVNEIPSGMYSLGPVFAFILWGLTLVLIAILVGNLSDSWRDKMLELRTIHEEEVLTDALTSVANRRAFEYELDRRLAQWNRDQTPLCLVLIDIDHFKKFNDRYGHQAGDAVLKKVALVLQQAVREVDLVARYGGEEFGLVLSGATADKAKDVAERARSLIESSRFSHRGLKLRVTISLGVAQIHSDEEITSLVQRADAALYYSKEAGRNCVHFHDGTTSQHFGQGVATETADWDKDDAIPDFVDVYADETTGLPTQRVFLEEFRRRTLETHRYNGELAVAIVAVDSLTQNIDHDVRTQKILLSTVSRLISTVMRETDLIARYDANYLSILLPVTSLEKALIPMRRLSHDSATYSGVQNPSLSYAVSIGIAEVLAAEPPGSTLQRAELALAASIGAGGDSVYMHDGTACQLVGPESAIPNAASWTDLTATYGASEAHNRDAD